MKKFTKITEFLDFGANFDLDRIFSFFFHIGDVYNVPTSPKPSFWPLSQKWQGCPKFLEYLYGEISLIWRMTLCSTVVVHVVFEKINYLLLLSIQYIQGCLKSLVKLLVQ